MEYAIQHGQQRRRGAGAGPGGAWGAVLTCATGRWWGREDGTESDAASWAEVE